MILAATTKSLQAVLAGVVATNQLPFVAAYTDIDISTNEVSAISESEGVTNSTTAVTLVAAPGSNIRRVVNYLSIRNGDTAAVTLTIQMDTSGTPRVMATVTLLVGDHLIYTNKGTWTVMDSTGALRMTLATTVTESNISLSDVTTDDVSTTKHGFAPKAPNDTAKFLRGDAGYGYPKERTTTITSSATPTPNGDTDDRYVITALAAAATIGAPTGTPRDGQKLLFRIKDNGTARALTWNSAYVAAGVSLPSTTVVSKLLRVGFEYSTASSKWECIASAQEA